MTIVTRWSEFLPLRPHLACTSRKPYNTLFGLHAIILLIFNIATDRRTSLQSTVYSLQSSSSIRTYRYASQTNMRLCVVVTSQHNQLPISVSSLQVQRRPLYPAQVPATATGAHRLARGNILVNCVVFAIPTPCHFTIKFAFFI